MKKVIAASLIIFGCALGYAQSVDAKDSKYNLTIKSPDAGQLSKHIDIPTSTHTGAVGIDIPVYTIQVGDFSLPISLKYHTSGVRVKETASKVGLGWALSVGGISLSKQIIGGEDRGKVQYINPDNFNPVPSNSNDFDLAMSLTGFGDKPRYDTQPDIYSYSIGGSAGEFYYDSAGKIIQIPYNTVKVEDVFTLTDNDGVKYYFKPGNKTRNLGGGIPSPNDFNTTDFVVTKIVLTSGKEIKFNYLASSYTYLSNFYRGIKIPRACMLQNGIVYEEYPTQTNVITENVLQSVEFEGSEVKFIYNNREDIMNGLALSKIEVRNPQKALVADYSLIKDYFVSSDTPSVPGFEAEVPYAMKRLKLKEVVNNLDNSKYKLQYYETNPLPSRLSEQTDFVGFYNGKVTNRGIPFVNYGDKIYGFGDDKNPDINYAVSGSLKEIQYPTGGKMNLEYELDDFRFSGVETHIGQKDFLITNYEPLGGTFNVNTDAAKVDLKITFQSTTSPNEGSEGSLPEGPHFVGELLDNNDVVIRTFLINKEYELLEDKKPSYKVRIRKVGNVNSIHTASINVQWFERVSETKEYNKSVGGIRVQKLSKTDANNTTNEVSFIYKDENNKSTGVYLADDIDYSYIQQIAEDENFGYSCEQMVISNSGNFNIATINGKPTVYNKVTTRFKNTSNNESYDVVDEYMNVSHTNPKNAQHPIFTYANNQFARGLLTRKLYYDTQKKLVKKDTITYEFDNHFNSQSSDYSAGFPNATIRPYFIGIKAIRCMTTDSNGNCQARNPEFTVDRYEMTSAWVKKTATKTTNYFTNGNLDELTNYSYDTNYKHTNPMMINVEMSGSSQQTEYQYAHEKGNQKLIAANMISIPLETSVTKKQNANDSTGKLVSKAETKYDHPSLLFPTSVVSYGINTGAQSTEVTYDQYDAKGNLQQYTINGMPPTAVVWGYNTTKPIAKIEGVTYAHVLPAINAIVNASDTDNTAGSNNDETALLDAFKAFRAQFPNSPVTTYTYDPLVGVRSITPPTGITEFYTYDLAGRLIKVADANGKVVKEMKYNYKN